MVTKTNKGYVVRSESGKSLSKPYATRQQAERRLRQIHYFQNKK